MGNQNVHLIHAKERTPQHKLNVVTQSGLAIDGAQLGNAKQTTMEWVQKSTIKPPTFQV